jgi:ribonuclease P protein component
VLPKKHRIHKDSDFKEIFSSRKVVYSKYLSINFDFKLKNPDTPKPQVAVVTSKKVSNKAHIRNKLRRQIYSIIRETEIYRENKAIRMIVVCKSAILDLSFKEIKQEVENLLQKIKFQN